MSLRYGLIPVGRLSNRLSLLARSSARHNLNRPLSTGLKTEFRHNPSKLDALSQILHSSVLTKNLGDIHRYYPLLVRESKRTAVDSDSVPPLASQEQLDSLLHVLASSARPFDLSLIESILADLPNTFNITLTPSIHTTVLRSLVNRGQGNPQTILNWLVSMPGKPGGFTASRPQWHLYLEFCAQNRELVGLLKAGVGAMKKAGCKPTNVTFRIVLGGLLSAEEGVHLPDVLGVLGEMEGEGLKFDPPIAQLLFDRLSALFGVRKAKEVVDSYRSRFSFGGPGNSAEAAVNKQIEEEGRKNGFKAAVTLCKLLQNDGFSPSPMTLSAILKSAKSAQDLAHVERKLDRKANVIHWSIVIGNVLRTKNVASALEIYDACQETGVLPDAAMVQPLISALCHDGDDVSLDRALELYQDVVRSAREPSSSSARPRGPDPRTFQTLLRALASSTNTNKFFPKAVDLLSDMKAFSITPDVSIVTSTIILYMRHSRSHEAAFAAYRERYKSSDGIVLLDTKGFTAVLGAFCKLSFENREGVPPPQLYFEIVKDMRLVGCQMSSEVYTILLRQIAVLASQLPRHGPAASNSNPNKLHSTERTEDLRETLVSTVRRAHNHLTLDPTLTPDTALYNQLMDTYQRLGCFEEALRLFELLLLSRQLDSASVSIIFDACGWAGNERMARSVFARLVGAKTGGGGWGVGVMNVRNWNAWVECLCRLGKLSEATKVVCLEMGYGSEDGTGGVGVNPNEESVRILMSFASRANREDEVKSKIRRYLPDLWDRIEDRER